MIYQLKFVFVSIFLIPQLTDGGRITWHRPAPVQITSNPDEVLPPGIVPAYVGEPATLKWNYSLTENLLAALVKFDGDTIVSIGSTGIAGAIASNFQGRFSVSSDTRSVTLSILKATVADDKDNGNFSCEVITDAPKTWIRNIQVQVRGVWRLWL